MPDADKFAALVQEVASLRKIVEDLSSFWGTYFTTEGQQLRFMVLKLYGGGVADGIAFGSVSGGTFLVNDIPMGKPVDKSPYWEPRALPKAVLELFEPAPEVSEVDGDNTKAVA